MDPNNFNDAAVDAVFNSLISLALQSAYFDNVNQHEPKSAPGYGITCSVWIQTITPIRGSGQAATSGLLLMNMRLYTSMTQQPFDMIDPNITKAVTWMMGAISGKFQLGLPDTRNVDLLGINGYLLSAQAGYVEIDRKMMRVMTMTVPIVINDMWAQSA